MFWYLVWVQNNYLHIGSRSDKNKKCICLRWTEAVYLWGKLSEIDHKSIIINLAK